MTDEEIRKLAIELERLRIGAHESSYGDGRRVIVISETAGGAMSNVDFFFNGELLRGDGCICDTLEDAVEVAREGPHIPANRRKWLKAKRRSETRQ